MLNHPLSASYFEVVNKYLSGTLLLNNGEIIIIWARNTDFTGVCRE
ncbi:Hypothetical protein SMB2099_1792 [Serratia marcescens SMB2099]|nr:Hypothetical protein SMB2099_1792 [Serratia marcescens SMB2099]